MAENAWKRVKDECCIVDEYVLNAKLKDINPMFFSHIKHFSGTNDGPVKRNFTMIRYFLSGSGYFVISGQRYPIEPGNAYIVPQGVLFEYYITEEAESIYVAFDGEVSRDFALLDSVIPASPDIFNEILAAADYEGRKDLLVASILMRWYLELCPNKTEVSKDYITEVKEYIDENYMRPIKVEDIAAKFNMNRSYLSRTFKKKVGMSMKEYIISVRLKEAKQMLNYGKNVTEAAYLCGFGSQSHFSSAFKQFYSEVPKVSKNEREKKKYYSEFPK